MKRNDAGDFCVLYVEPEDEKEILFETILGQHKPVVIMLAEQARIFQRPDDFALLKHIKRQLDKAIVFVIPGSEHLMQLAGRQGFPVYLSMDALADAISTGNLSRQRPIGRTTSPLGTNSFPYPNSGPLRGTAPLTQKNDSQASKTAPLGPPPSQSPLPPRRPYNRVVALAIVITVMLILGGTMSFFLIRYQQLTTASAAKPQLVGRILFTSSQQLSENSSQGINDKVLIDLHGLPATAKNKSYYAWLLSDKSTSDTSAVALGALQVDHGNVHQTYQGDAQHTNLLVKTSRFLITEEDSAVTPLTPSLDVSTWRFYGEIPQVPINAPDNTKHFSYLDHLRHLLATDPTLDGLELPGGLNNWYYRNSGKILEWTSSMREQWEETKDTALLRRQTIRTLTYLDGLTFVQKDIPPSSPVYLNERLARIGLINVAGPAQEPSSYIEHIVHHINGLLQTTSASTELRKDAGEMISSLNNTKFCFEQIRRDALQIMKMSDEQLRTSDVLTLINDMIANANHAYIGNTDPTTGQMHQGVVWIHDHMQLLATFEISTYTPASSSIQMVPDQKHNKAQMSIGVTYD